MADLPAADRAPMASAPLRYCADGTVDWGGMWDSFCALALDGGPPHRGTRLEVPQDADPTCPAYRFAIAELARGIAAVSGLTAHPAGTGWRAIECPSGSMARWLAAAIEAERVQARAEGARLLVPVGEWTDVSGEIKNVITVVAKTTHYWTDHLPPGVRSALAMEERIERCMAWLRRPFARRA